MNNDLNAQTSNYEASLSEEGRYRLLIESIRDYAIFMLDAGGFVANWNAGAERFKGYRPEDIIGTHFSVFYTEEDKSSNLPQRALAAAERYGVYETEGWRVRKDGSRFWASIVIDPIRDKQGRLVGYAKVTRDLTERKRAEEELRSSQGEFAMLLQGVKDFAIYRLNPDGIVSTWNAGAARIKGYTADEIVGKHFSVFFTEADRAGGEPQNAIETAKREGKFEREAWRVRKDGTRFRAHVVLNAVHNEAGHLVGLVKITRDITEKYEAQQALERTKEALFQSQKTEAIGRLTGGVAHDFNNLLAAIVGNLELVRKHAKDQKLIALVDNALLGAKRGTTLTQRMLAFARRSELHTERVDVLALIHGMTDLLQRSIGAENVLETHFPVGLPAVLTDPNQLESALLNLVVNARDALPIGGTIIIGGRAVDGGQSVAISVSDNGEGMDEETARRASEPFFTTKGVGKGTGLGLSTVQGLVEQSGGTLKIESRKGHGTMVELVFPAAPERKTEGAEKAPPMASVPTHPLKILVVDDDSLVLMGTQAMLEDLGHTVLAAGSGAEALEILKTTGDIELLITDQAMPNMTGLALAHEVKEFRTDLPIIIATGYAELPQNGFPITRLAKPFLQNDIEAAISEAKNANK